MTLIDQDRQHVWHPFTQAATADPPILIRSAQGATLHGADGRDYLDLISSWWVTTHGHAHPAIAAAIAAQATCLEQVMFAGFTHEPAVRLAVRLAELLPAPLSRVFYSDNGSTAVEVAIKMALQYHRNLGRQRTRLLVLEGGYHGDTVGAMSAGRSCGFFEAFAPLLFEVDLLPVPVTWIGDEAVEAKEAAALQRLDRYLEQHGAACAALLAEPLVQGAGGMRMMRPGFLQAAAQRLHQAGALLILDEVMTGFGRLGTLFACERAGVTPDLICLSKGLTSGFLPLSVTVASEAIYQAFLGDSFHQALAHGHSFTANPLGCAAALASLALFDGALGRIAELERQHARHLAALAGHPRLARPRLCGSVAALDVVTPNAGYHADIGPWLKRFFLDRGLNLRPLGNVVYLLPPYCLTDDELTRAWNTIGEALDQVP